MKEYLPIFIISFLTIFCNNSEINSQKNNQILEEKKLNQKINIPSISPSKIEKKSGFELVFVQGGNTLGFRLAK